MVAFNLIALMLLESTLLGYASAPDLDPGRRRAIQPLGWPVRTTAIALTLLGAVLIIRDTNELLS